MSGSHKENHMKKRKQIIHNANLMHQHLEETRNVDEGVNTGLNTLFTTQMAVSSLVEGCIPDEIDHPTPDQIRTYFLALNVELMELLQELSWKPWKNYKEPNQKKVAEEFADILAFLGVIIIYLDRMGVPTEVLASAYARKSMVNIERMLGEVEGYDKPQGK
jgi:NTP pyrophosphatase (non-canonical NTP hydrolase)